MRSIADILFRFAGPPMRPYANRPVRPERAPRRGFVANAVLAAAGATSLSSCSDPNAASDANFRAALEPVVRDAFCKTIPVERMSLTANGETPSFPIVVPARPFETGSRSDADSRKMLEAAAQDGWLTRTETTASARRLSRAEPLTPQALVTYTPTDKGNDRFRPVERKTVEGKRLFPAVCVAQSEIVEIVRWTDPADMFGQTVSQVTYTLRGMNMMEGMPAEMRTAIDQPTERTVTLVQTSDGWRPI